MSRRRSVLVLGLGAVVLTGCGARGAAGESSEAPTTTVGPSAVTAQQVVAAFDSAELPVTGAEDTTKADCGTAVRCTQSITTAEVTVRSFPGSGPAELYANPVNAFHVFTITLTFASSVGAEQQQAYEAIAARVAS